MPQHRRLTYGDHPSQYVDILEPDEPAAALVHVIHGGFWREALSAELTAPIARDLCTDGFLVANIEYRRVGGGGGWPETFEDVKAAIAAVRQAKPDLVRSFAVGHSAGGHLSLLALAAGSADFAVALAPVSDVDRALREDLGDGAAAEFLGVAGSSPREVRTASPIGNLGHRRQHVLIHGLRDVNVPVEHSQHYVSAARASGTPVDYFEFANLDHFDLIDPASSAWCAAKQWIRYQLT
ncbi:alpha/beta hydrolase family protein [Mycobacteroides abscessus]|uniref:Putative lipase/esterase n=3 Tax=Mycobacteroides abscessus TaxID=36809 RepID=A0A0U0ZMS5_9MYCO|nr:alpha/beta hydrolase [Mycobacteroides abscessus]MBL3735257.1 prolyl oligopeptidase family serine peptidase [Mycobacteroides abscessus subsp. massiliense]MBL3761287.1 prolyl oligopeptidase family serine peptidase [Mycobacteroides abscessus subsp. massiliense]MBN7482429.1 prolyl oligopeptidase family serine peptidase [Mycobacteroides abscessus subsp. massiliense]MDB2213654.1 alpha/beta hydrolase [Mycobacteroides abscessus subsp. massiliense]MDM2102827.1 alpha/beta hydrolase [Mycobacteroides a